MDRRLLTAWLYGTTAVVCTALYFYGSARSRSLGSPWLDIPSGYEIAALTVASVALSLTRSRSRAAPVLEVCAALLWCATFLSYALWFPMFNTVQHLGAPLIDALAVVFGLAAVTFLSLAVQGVMATGLSARALLQGIGVGLLGVYLGRVGALFYASTRETLSRGVAAMSSEARLHAYACGVAAVALIASAVLPRGTSALENSPKDANKT